MYDTLDTFWPEYVIMLVVDALVRKRNKGQQQYSEDIDGSM